MLKLLVLLMCSFVFASRPYCNQRSVLQNLSVPTYDFSVDLLDRVSQETKGHFVFSPISTWLQLLSLADGAQGKTLKEIVRVTRQRWVCSRNIVRKIFNLLDIHLNVTMKHRSIFVIDKLLDVKDSFVTNVEMLNTATVLLIPFNNNTGTVARVDEIINFETNRTINLTLDNKDFVKTVLLMIDVASMKSNWKSPFNPVYTNPEIFYSHENVPIGYVNMMAQTGYFNVKNIPEINAKALELPFSDRSSMILLLPNVGRAEDMFLTMANTRMRSILRFLKSNNSSLINVKMPRFNVTTDIDNLPELLHDMGIERAFSPRLAEFGNISDYRVLVSLMANKFNIEVTERGVSANIGPEAVIKNDVPVEISFNRPFVYFLVDKISNVILFAGVYSKPYLF